MNFKAPEISVIILNYKNADLTAKCVHHLSKAAEEAEIPIQTIIVDNSAPETARKLKKLLPQDDVEIIENSKNMGFSKANNQGIRISKGKYILLLNNDAFVNQECLKGGIKYLEEHDDCGIWAPKLVGEDGSFQVSCARLPSIKGLIGEYLLLDNYDWYPDLAEWTEPHDVGNVIGAYMLIKRSVVEKVGMLDEDFFFTVEDVDYCKRVHEAGFSVAYDPKFSVVHISGASQDKGWVNDPYMHRNRVLYFQKNHGKLKAALTSLIIKLGLKRMKKS